MKIGIGVLAGILIGAFVTFIYLYQFVFIPFVEAENIQKQAEIELLNLHIKNLRGNNVEPVIYWLESEVQVLNFEINNIHSAKN